MKHLFTAGIILAAGLVLTACANAASSEPVLSVSSGAEYTEETEEPELNNDGTYSYGIEEINIQRNGMNIYGELYVPQGESDLPIVILSHGFGGTHRDLEAYASAFAEKGFSAFAYDFIGGGAGSRSDGTMTDMSVLTEAEDLNAVLDYFQEYDGVDPEHIFLLGASQGGFVSTYVAGERPQDVAGLIVLYPAYVLQDDSSKRNPNPENGPDTSSIMGMTVGKIYDIDAQSFDIYDSMASYPGRVLIIHGTADSIVPISYSERAAETFPNAELITIEGAGHGFYGSAEETASAESIHFAEEIMNGDDSDSSEETDAQINLQMKIEDTSVEVLWEDNESVDALTELAAEEPLTIQMSMYGGFEQLGSLGTSLPREDEQTTTSAGDIVLYSGNQIVVFYGSNTWAYTRLGKITDKDADEMAELLGNGDVEITISVQNE